MTKKIVVFSGSRDWTDPVPVKKALLSLDPEHYAIMHGGAFGLDVLAGQLAEQLGFDVRVMRADWSKHGKAAGPIRNREMLEQADMCYAFWDGESRGTKNTIDTAKELGVELHIVV